MGELVWQRMSKKSRKLLKRKPTLGRGRVSWAHPPLWPHGFQWHDASLTAPSQMGQLWQEGVRPWAYLLPLQKKPWKADNLLSPVFWKGVATLLAVGVQLPLPSRRFPRFSPCPLRKQMPPHSSPVLHGHGRGSSSSLLFCIGSDTMLYWPL